MLMEVKFRCHWLKLVASVGQKYVRNYANKNHSLIPLGAKVPSLKMSLCSFLFRVSLFPRCKLIPQISMCLCEWPGRLKYLATGLDRSDRLCFSHQVNVLESGHLPYFLY